LTTASRPGPLSSSSTEGCIAGRNFCSESSFWTPSWTALFRASCSSAAPCIFLTRLGGTLPGRKPGIRICGATLRNSPSTRASISFLGMVIR
jgi:hypothetical protein